MLLMDYLSIRGVKIPDYAKKVTWNILHEYIDAHSQILIIECPEDGAQAISILKSQCAIMTFYGKIR